MRDSIRTRDRRLHGPKPFIRLCHLEDWWNLISMQMRMLNVQCFATVTIMWMQASHAALNRYGGIPLMFIDIIQVRLNHHW
jgi:hypothetical protein